jgi:hypothetical protein
MQIDAASVKAFLPEGSPPVRSAREGEILVIRIDALAQYGALVLPLR